MFAYAHSRTADLPAHPNDFIKRLVERKKASNETIEKQDLHDSIFEGAVPRVRPLLMTVLANILGLIPILISTGTGSDLMKPIAIPFVFGLVSSTIFVLVLLPVFYQVVREYELKKTGTLKVLDIEE